MIDYSNYKTIKQIADEIGVTRQAIHKRIKQEPLSNDLQRSILSVGNTVYINNDGVNLIKSVFIKDIGATSTLSTDLVDHIDQVDSNTYKIVNQVNSVDSTKNELVDNVNEVDSEPFRSVNQVDSLSSKFIESLQNQIQTLTEQNQDLREQLNQERIHSREQSNKVISLAEQLAKLNENNQILLKKEQERNTLLIPEQLDPSEDKVKRPFWQFWKKR